MALQAIQLPDPPRGYGTSTAEVVRDAANVMSAESVERVNRLAFDVHAKSGGELTVVTLPDIGPRDAADVALAIGREWKVGSASEIGDRARNAGVVILIVPKETSSDGRGRCRIEVGRGTEGFLLDADAGTICREATPLFQQRDYGAAIEFITMRVAQEFAREFGFALDSAVGAPIIDIPRAQPGGRRERGGFPPLLWLIIFFFVLSALGGSGRGKRKKGCGGCLPIFIPMGGGGGSQGGWGGGGFGGGGGGGFGGFGGGGGFSGGGGGSSW